MIAKLPVIVCMHASYLAYTSWLAHGKLYCNCMHGMNGFVPRVDISVMNSLPTLNNIKEHTHDCLKKDRGCEAIYGLRDPSFFNAKKKYS